MSVLLKTCGSTGQRGLIFRALQLIMLRDLRTQPRMQLGQGYAANFAFSQAAKRSSLLARLSRQRCSFASHKFISLLDASHLKKQTSSSQHCIQEGNFLLGKCYPGVILHRVLIRNRGVLTPRIHPQWATSPHLGQSPPTKGHARGRGRLTAGGKEDNKASCPKNSSSTSGNEAAAAPTSTMAVPKG